MEKGASNIILDIQESRGTCKYSNCISFTVTNALFPIIKELYNKIKHTVMHTD